ncbi:MAG: phage holin family protein [Cetobacterium sp.]|uniref:phage holin family protein n=1 Tax=Cetobacterium sp. TaxID=2071632 RepID=UPI003EE81C13
MTQVIDYSNLLNFINVIVCSLTALRLMFFVRENSRYKFGYSLLAYLLIVAMASNVIYLLTGEYSHTHPSELVINFIICVNIFLVKGNIAKLVGVGR